MSNSHHAIGLYLPELGLAYEEGLAKAAELGVEHIWHSFSATGAQGSLHEMSDDEVDGLGRAAADAGVRLFLLSAGAHFKQLHLADLELDSLERHADFQRDFRDMERAMEVAAQLGVGAVNVFTFAWPGEYTAGKPTWPMRWLTRGGHIAQVDMDKLVKAFTLIAEAGERHDVDVVLGMMCWNYTNTTGNLRRVLEAVGSPRLKVMLGPADCVNCGESDVATAGLMNARPYLYGLHLKDLRVNDGLALDFDYCPIGEGDVDYPTLLRSLLGHEQPLYLSVSTHFVPASGSREEAMRINIDNLRRLLGESAGDR
jgi:sugar phosphate isomerase/epimerase